MCEFIYNIHVNSYYNVFFTFYFFQRFYIKGAVSIGDVITIIRNVPFFPLMLNTKQMLIVFFGGRMQ